MIKQLIAASRGMYTTWVLVPEHGILFDCGEGCASYLGQSILSVRHLFIGHAHFDHIAGLINFMRIRNRAPEAQRPHLTIHYPAGCMRIEQLWDLLPKADSTVTWHTCYWYEPIPLGGKLEIRMFPTDHVSRDIGYTGLGFVLREKRSMLRRELDGLSQLEIAAHVKLMKQTDPTFSASQPYEQALVAYTGDTLPCAEEHADVLRGVEVLIHDATYLKREHRPEGARHSSMDEAARAARDLGAKVLVPMHISAMYGRNVQMEVETPDVEGLRIIPIQPTGWGQTIDI